MNEQKTNPLGTEKISNLLLRFAIPSIIAMVVSALYNMVDQFFIGRSVGMLGNAATNVAFPLVITCTAIALMCGIGGAANFNLCMGQQEKEEAASFAGNAITMLFSLGMILCIITRLFLPQEVGKINLFTIQMIRYHHGKLLAYISRKIAEYF